MSSTTLDMESRVLTTTGPVELRAGGSGLGVLAGYAAVFNRYSQNLGGFVEQVDPAAFNKSLADNAPVMARGNHDDAYLLGTTWGNTLRLSADGTGLRYEVDLPDTTVGRDYKVLAERGDLRWSSFAFRTLEDDWGVTEQGFPLRTLRSVVLIDVAPVNSPAYLDSTVGLRSLAHRLGVDDVKALAADEVRAKLAPTTQTTEPAPEARSEKDDDGQRATHPPLALRRRLLELDAQK